MMHLDEMKILREAWDHPDPPSPHRRAEARAALLRRAARDRSQPARQPATNRWRPSRRLVFSATVVTTAIAVGFALVQLAPTTPPSPEMGGPGVRQVWGRSSRQPVTRSCSPLPRRRWSSPLAWA